ncbi:GNAT family N-acetyltransferase [Nonomuraea roseoviolacea]|uniref:Ribosomal protein S18 acetylase RimI-like enzyme n=1 Tax=Nonomuraea roseoviolacea subsp. carminata TaxID=160689 RepID=A0ABT1K1N3_9ACTN|nr:GNAT family N-acetyltransferase [Nonomuraea roseoviolacea]MCP2347770.1 ribosomal protein S18 acetylase RimI-like enzyme [Nonomuraea roseoviolacea subsp. carminata]
MTSSSPAPVIRRAGAYDVPRVAELIATAFEPLAAVSYLVPEPRGRHEIMTADFRILVEQAVRHGEIDLIDDAPAVAVWFPRVGPLPEPPGYEQRLAAAAGPWLERFLLLDSLFDKHHPDEPHHHLAFLAVHPARQGRGLGSALLRHHHARLGGLPAYLEASSPRSRDLYLRHGYRPRETFALPDGATFWPMWRPGDAPSAA